MGSLFSPPKPSLPQETAAEKQLNQEQLQEAASANADAIKQIQDNLQLDTSQTSGTVGRKSLLTNSSAGFSLSGLRSILGG